MYQIADQLSTYSDSGSLKNSPKYGMLQKDAIKEEYKSSSFMPKSLKPTEGQEKKYRVLIANDEIFLLDFLEQMFQAYF